MGRHMPVAVNAIGAMEKDCMRHSTKNYRHYKYDVQGEQNE